MYNNTEESCEAYIAALKAAVDDVKAPFCSGTLPVNQSRLLLFYGNAQGVSGRIDLNRASDVELKHLVDACEPATFGRNNEDVLDESYRKACKLDEQYFSTKLELDSIGLTEIIGFGLLEGSKGARAFRAELYKLNVYDKGAFFKAHKDTPRGEKMFGSLVIVFPTEHEGGALLLRHGGKEWSVDSGRLLAEKRRENAGQAHIVFATFFGDVEHEVTPVTSGYRVTLTYNLYFDPDSTPAIDRQLQLNKRTIPSDADVFKKTLTSILQDPGFFPYGVYLGFGLYHQYAIDRSSNQNISGLRKYLKGRDAMILQACEDLSLDAQVCLVYDMDDGAEGKVFTRQVLDLADIGESSVYNYAEANYGAEFIDRNSLFYWIRERSKLNGFSTDYMAYGNESYRSCVYADVCLLVHVGASGNRSEVRY